MRTILPQVAAERLISTNKESINVRRRELNVEIRKRLEISCQTWIKFTAQTTTLIFGKLAESASPPSIIKTIVTVLFANY